MLIDIYMKFHEDYMEWFSCYTVDRSVTGRQTDAQGEKQYVSESLRGGNIIMYTPVNPSFTIQKWGLRGPKLYKYVFRMNGI